jgi:hypothetical protein
MNSTAADNATYRRSDRDKIMVEILAVRRLVRKSGVLPL